MLKEYRCGKCRRLLARLGKSTEAQIKCPRCGALNHLKTESLKIAPLSPPLKIEQW
ncbi:Com family DNA-binding transcriptional regulator [Pseudomonas pseudonitroreducens]|uniref:Com family DNA-binding transcriptional regulator n=1 Tax=Pseudomonas pseudonitroreducens TaxID=2892326 RepID=UPI001F34B8B8|nr:Com family DNA-binding transcriptional regulator [Pseudomonas pseudonitroreducens]